MISVDMNRLSAMMREYVKTKAEYTDCILMYRLGDFYEMFFDDAKTASRELDLTLTGKDCGLEERAPMCGIPFHAADTYIARLVSKGYKVAICEQMEDPKEAKGLVKRDVIRVVTPGTILDSAVLDLRPANYMCCINKKEKSMGLAIADVSTGEVLVTFLNDDAFSSGLISELERFSPVEIILNAEAFNDKNIMTYITAKTNALSFSCDESYFEFNNSKKVLDEQFGHEAEKIYNNESVTGALGALLSYIKETQKVTLQHIKEINYFETSQFMEIGSIAQRNLELVESMQDRGKRGTLLWVLDKTCTTMGTRTIKNWILRPLIDPIKIKQRQDAVGEMAEKLILRSELRDILSKVNDLERMVSRVSLGTVNPRDLVALKTSLMLLPQIKRLSENFATDFMKKHADEIDTLGDIANLIDMAIVDKDTPISVRDGKIIKPGFSEHIDYYNNLMTGSKGVLSDIEKRERDRTQIPKLKVGYNKVFGYYIEVSNVNLSKVPDDYIRKQTLTSGERFITQELKEVERDVLSASEKAIGLEYDAFMNIVEEVKKYIESIQKTSRALGIIDVICSFAEVAVKNSYCMPIVDASEYLEIKDGRHPVVELMNKGEIFVPNDTVLSSKEDSMAIITGPNMAGKSTYMRQVALIVIMAQIGSFVPASFCRVGIADKIFTRVGASDDLSSGRSTYMVEMSEVADIVNHATKKSLIILDEIGRGTSTFDGLSMAWAIVEYCCKEIKARTLFATHYHELTELENTLPRTKNYCVVVKKRGDDIIFLRKIIRGGADESYGIEVAK
ncbi:MAG: DNA mismatch repair protein MutS, partial [Bacillota bacterium]|nr:DNA mismatch repair protein MutS [Bacillota bacterium]